MPKLLIARITIFMFIPILSMAGQNATKTISHDSVGTTKSLHLIFDVASIREARDGNMSYIDNMPRTSYYHAERVAPWGLILHAYGVKLSKLLEGLPAWAMDTRYNLTAKSDATTDEALAKMTDEESYEEKRRMMQELLEERFKLKIHPETRITTTYEMVTTKRNAELMTPVHSEVAKTVSTCNQHYSSRGIEVDAKGCPFTILFSNLRQALETEIADHTGLTGSYATT